MVDLAEPHGASECAISSEFGNSRLSVLLRRIEERDRPWLVDLCKRRYPAYYSAETAEAWLINKVLPNPIQYYATRSCDAFQITNLTHSPWVPQASRADVVFICAEEGKTWQALMLLKDSIKWARERRAYAWRFETETEFDLAPLMARLGARQITPRYHMFLRDNP